MPREQRLVEDQAERLLRNVDAEEAGARPQLDHADHLHTTRRLRERFEELQHDRIERLGF